jgi:hypothetical protein
MSSLWFTKGMTATLLCHCRSHEDAVAICGVDHPPAIADDSIETALLDFAIA